MTTEITYSFNKQGELIIKSAFFLDYNTIAVFTSNDSDNLSIHIIGKTKSTIELSDLSELSSSTFYKKIFKYENGFGIIDNDDNIIVWPDYRKTEHLLYKIKNPFHSNSDSNKPNPYIVDYDSHSKRLIVALEDHNSINSARYWSTIELIDEKFKWLKGRTRKCKWIRNLSQLNLDNYPETEHRKFLQNKEWLFIEAITMLNSNPLIYTKGGSVSGLKSGPEYEFSIMSKFDSNGMWIENYNLENGKGVFSTNKKHYILQPHSSKNSLFVYSTEDFRLVDKISLTKRQNLGDNKPNAIKADIQDDMILIYNANFLNICRNTTHNIAYT